MDSFDSTNSTELRVFLSSTFTDMQREREYLLKKVFPEIRRLCREREIIFTEVDLRWGITERQARQHKVVELCLDEISRHKPYILTLVGDRYGWQPSERDLGNRDQLTERYPWLQRAIQNRRSLTELESLEAPLHNPELKDRVRYYFKSKTDRKRPDDTPNDLKERKVLKEFRARVRDASFFLREGYRTPEQLGKWVRDDLIAILDEIAPERGGHDSWLLRERRGHEAFATSRRRAYIEHEPTLRAIDRYVEQNADSKKRAGKKGEEIIRSTPLMITGESGAGKSALLAWWGERHRVNNPDAFVIEHYVGATPGSSDRFGLLRRIMVEIKERYDVPEEPPVDPTQIVDEFPAWLARTSGEQVILLLDALNQLADTNHLGWLPLDFNSSVRLIISTLPGSLLEVCKEREWNIMSVKPLGEKDRRRAVRAYLGGFGKQLEPAQTRRIASDKKTANPLYLRTSLEELRLLNNHEQLSEQINHYLAADDLEDLYRRILERLEKDYGKGLTRSVMCSIWASHNGLSLEELRGILNKPTAQIAQLLTALEYHLLRREGLMRFHHDYLRGAVERRYLKSTQGKRSAHRRVAKWFSGEPVSERRALEELWGWEAAKATEELGQTLINPEIFRLMNTDENRFTLLRFWQLAEGSMSLSSGKNGNTLPTPSNLKGKQLIEHLTEAARFLQVAGHYADAAKLVDDAVILLKRLPSEQEMLCHALRLLGSCQTEAGNYNNAEKNLIQSMRLTAKLYGTTSLEYAEALEILGTFCYQTRRFEKAKQVLTKALQLRNNTQGKNHPTAASTSGMLGAIYYGLAQYDRAEKYFLHELQILKQHSTGEADIGVATCINNLGTLLTQSQRYEDAINYFQQAVAIYKQTYGPNHPKTASILVNLSLPLQQLGLIEEAEQMLRQAIAINEVALGSDHPTIAVMLTNLGTMLLNKMPERSLESYKQALAIRKECFPLNHSHVVQSQLNVAAALRRIKLFQEDALPLYKQYLPIFLDEYGTDDPTAKLFIDGFEKLKVDLEEGTITF